MPSVWSLAPPRHVAKAILFVLGVGLLAVLALWLLPRWLTQDPDLGSAADQHSAEADARTGVLAFIAVVGGLGGLYYTSNTVRVSRAAQISASNYANETLRLTQATLLLSERGQITDRYSRAVDQLGDESPEVCVGGIYALGQIMLDTDGGYEAAIVAVLSAFIRRTAKRRDDLVIPWDQDEAERDEVKPSFRIQAALNVFVRSRPLAVPPDLRDSDLRGARLRGAQLTKASLRRSYLYGAKLASANLSGASLHKADLTRAELTNTLLVNADLTQADLTDADLVGADLTGANLANADLTGARIVRGTLADAQLKTVRNGDNARWVAGTTPASPAPAHQGPEPI
jgi:hypothetical protein